MKKNRRIEKRMIAAILCVATLISQMHIADAADLQISDSNTSQEQISYEEDIEREGNVDIESDIVPSEKTNEEPDNDEGEAPDKNIKTETTEDSTDVDDKKEGKREKLWKKKT